MAPGVFVKSRAPASGGDVHVRGALEALEKADGQAWAVRRDMRLRALRWGLVWYGLAVGISTMSLTFSLDFVTLLWLAGLLLVFGIQVYHAPILSTPGEAAAQALRATLVEAGQHLRLIETHGSFRSEPMEWIGDDPTASARPWTKVSAIRGTAAAVRRQALPAASAERPDG
jgi:hypothetical protein